MAEYSNIINVVLNIITLISMPILYWLIVSTIDNSIKIKMIDKDIKNSNKKINNIESKLDDLDKKIELNLDKLENSFISKIDSVILVLKECQKKLDE